MMSGIIVLIHCIIKIKNSVLIVFDYAQTDNSVVTMSGVKVRTKNSSIERFS